MPRDKSLVEKHLSNAEQEIKAYVSTKVSAEQDKKALRKDPKWRRMKAIADKFKVQLSFIEKRNKKPEPKV